MDPSGEKHEPANSDLLMALRARVWMVPDWVTMRRCGEVDLRYVEMRSSHITRCLLLGDTHMLSPFVSKSVFVGWMKRFSASFSSGLRDGVSLNIWPFLEGPPSVHAM